MKVKSTLLIIVILITGCSREFTNPYDPGNDSPDAWLPRNLSATIASENSVNLVWQNGCNFPVEYKVERRVNYGSFVELATVTSAEYTDPTIERDNFYTYRIRALAENNVSIASNTQKLKWAEPGYQIWSLDSMVTSFHDTLSEMLSVGISHDGSLIATGEEMQTRLWNVEAGELIWSGRNSSPGYFIRFRPDDAMLQAGNATIDVQNLSSTASDVEAGAYCFKYLPDNSGYAYAASKYFYMKFFDGSAEWGKFEEPYYYHFTSVDFHPTENRLVNGSTSKLVRVYKIRGENWYGDLIWTGTHPDAVTTVAYSPDGSKIAAGSEDGTIHVWNASPGSSIGEILLTMRHTGSVNHLVYSPDGNLIISGSEDYTLRAWNTATGALNWTINTSKPVRKFFISSDAEFIVALQQDKKLTSWSDVEDGYFSVYALSDGSEMWTGGTANDIDLCSNDEVVAAVTGNTLAVYSTKAKWIITN